MALPEQGRGTASSAAAGNVSALVCQRRQQPPPHKKLRDSSMPLGAIGPQRASDVIMGHVRSGPDHVQNRGGRKTGSP